MRHHHKVMSKEAKGLERILELTGMQCFEDFESALHETSSVDQAECTEQLWAIAREALIALQKPIYRNGEYNESC